MAEKSDQVIWLEKELGRPLLPCLSDSVSGRENRKTYLLDEHGNVTGLNLYLCSITDGSFLKELTSLQSLVISYNGITDGSFLKELTSLQSLDISFNEITNWNFLKNLTSLQSLVISHNRIADWSFLKYLTSLQSLDISFNGITDGTFLKDLTSLHFLDISANRITDGSFLKDLTSLQSLVISTNEITDWTFLKELTSLQSLVISYNGITDGTFLKGLTSLQSLVISTNEITDWSFLKEFTSLQSLVISTNEITDWTFLKELISLQSLIIRNNRITDGTFLKELTSLQSLDISFNEITDWSFLKDLTSLQSLVISDNGITDWSFLKDLTSLQSLNIRNNEITDGTFLKELTSLQSLDISNNEITDGTFLKELTSLQSLDISNNRITDMEWLPYLTRLRSLGIEENQITELPRVILRLDIEIESLQYLGRFPQSINVANNPLQSPPLEIIEQGHEAIVTWFGALEEAKRPLSEIKVILVGDGGAGKTTLRKRLMGEDADLNESQTHGVEIHDWAAASGNRDILVHFWDFGGQEIMRATHQFFLSHRSLYILVLNARENTERDVEDWLKNIESFGGDSPILVVLNKMDENPGFDVNRPFLTDKYKGLREFFKVSCLKKRGSGLPQLKKYLQQELGKVEMVHSLWPGTWFNVKQRLEDLNADYIGFDQFEGICRDERIPEENDQKILIRYLHDLGIAIHFEDISLFNTQVLNPRWATQAVYRIINAQALADGKGLLPLEMLGSILRKPDETQFHYPRDKHPFIIELMKKFELCYDVPQDAVLIPDLLDVTEPAFKFPHDNVLRFQFEYDFLPRSVIPRFIVNEHDDIDGELRWRTGVVLRDRESDTRALIKADVRDRKISITVTGERQREYFASLRRTFRRIHDSFNKLGVWQRVPLPDQPAYTVDYQDLLFHEEKGHSTILVGRLRREYPVRQLLDGIESAEERERQRLDPRHRGGVVVHGDYYEGGKQIMADHHEVNIGDNNQNLTLAFGDNINQVTAEKIKISLNRAQEADTAEAIKDILQQLHQEMATIAPKLPPDKAEEAADDLDKLTTEVIKDKPRRKWWQLSADGIKEAAQSVGEVGKTAIGLIEKLQPLLEA